MSNEDRHDEEQERPRIKVTDRRLFDREGNARDPDPEATESSVPSVEATEAHLAGAPAQDSQTGAPTAAKPQPQTAEAKAPEPPSQPRPAAPPKGGGGGDASEPIRVSAEALLQFVEEQYMMGMIALGAMPHPQTGEPAEDLDMAQLRIEMLESLEARTQSTREAQESQILEDALYRMRMLFLQKRKVAKL